MSRRLVVSIAFASALLANACMHDFSGYHLQDEAGGGTGSALNSGAGRADDEAGAAGVSSEGGSAGVAVAGNAGAAGAHHEPPVTPPSCVGLPSTCGPTGDASCCSVSVVTGGTYNRSNLGTAPATVSDFALDDYEVTVSRFRVFSAAYAQNMTLPGSGKNSHDMGGNPGWNALWNTRLPATAAALGAALQCPGGTFTPTPGANESKAVTCVSWYEAYAFCIWDGGRLPTEAEWNYAAAGGSDERAYPWGAASPDDTRAVFCPGSCNLVLAVGSKAPSGNGKWGQSDLVGNAWEWNLDVYTNPYPKAACNDCAIAPAESTEARVFRGGSAGNEASSLLAATRYSRTPGDHNGFVGLRCARNR